MAAIYIRYSGLTQLALDVVLSELEMSTDGVNRLVPVGITSDVAPDSGVLANLIDANLGTEASWISPTHLGWVMVEYNEMLPMWTHVRQASGATAAAQLSGALIEQSPDGISNWVTLHSGAIAAAGSANTYAAWTPLVIPGITENIAEYASFVEALEDNLLFLEDSAGSADAAVNQLGASNAVTDTATSTETTVRQYGYLNSQTDSAAAADSIESATFTMYLEAIGLSDSLAAGANTTTTYADSAVVLDIIQQAINQIVADTANGADSLNLGAALALVDIANAVAAHTPSYNSVVLVAEMIATLEAYIGAASYDITEAGVLSDAYVARVEALVAMLEAAQAVDTNTVLVHVMQLATDSADGTTAITSTGSLLNALLADSALATIRLNIGGELFTGWVLNTDTLAPSEYQFADLQFNSACKHGDTYLLAADDGIYQFTEDTGVETVMTYIKTGKTDFGSDLKKRVVNSYMVYSASGQMVLKVTTSEFGKLVTRNYRMTPQADDTTATRRIDIGKGVTSRYWQFEVVGEGVDCDIDEIGMLPIVLSRRI